MISESDRSAAAAALATAERDAVPIDPLVTSWPGLEVEDAYAIQMVNVRQRLASGSVVKGHKVGLTSRAMQEALGVDEPDYGHLFAEMLVVDGASLPTSSFCAPRVEVEVAFVLRESLAGPGVNAADVLRATELIMPAIEVIDSRVRDWKITLADTIADNASSARVVLGGRALRPGQVDLGLVGSVVRRNGDIVATGAAGAVLGNPANAVAWLANKLSAFEGSLEAGQVVMPGSCTPPVDVGPGDVIRAEFDGLGLVGIRFT